VAAANVNGETDLPLLRSGAHLHNGFVSAETLLLGGVRVPKLTQESVFKPKHPTIGILPLSLAFSLIKGQETLYKEEF